MMESNSPSANRITIGKFLWGILIITGVGAAAIMMQTTGRQQATDAFMLTTKHLKENAAAECPVAARQFLKSALDTADYMTSDGTTSVTLQWKGSPGGEFSSVDCTYVLDRGIVSLVVDGKTVMSK
ncbi:MAG: hypothetical protein ACREV8_02485 [Gammaproteobacteria bacterium]